MDRYQAINLMGVTAERVQQEVSAVADRIRADKVRGQLIGGLLLAGLAYVALRE